MNNLTITYVDDIIDKGISKFLGNLEFVRCNYTYHEYCFKDETYNQIITNNIVKEGDILLIDNALFENRKVRNKMYGNELKILLHMVYPFKKIITVSSKDYEDRDDEILSKFVKTPSWNNAQEYYNSVWYPKLESLAQSLWSTREIIDRINKKKYVDDYFYSKLSSSINGDTSYNDLSKKDIDDLIETFNKVRKSFEN